MRQPARTIAASPVLKSCSSWRSIKDRSRGKALKISLAESLLACPRCGHPIGRQTSGAVRMRSSGGL
jgi:hypothetical protein